MNQMKNRLFHIIVACAAIFTLSTFAAAQKKCTEDGSIKRVTKATSGKYETVTFEMLVKDPTYEVTTEKPPFSMYASDKPLKITGPYYKSVVIRGIVWECRIGEDLKAKTSNIKAVKSVEQFEGQVNYIIGYRKKGSYVGESVTKTKKGSLLVLKFKK